MLLNSPLINININKYQPIHTRLDFPALLWCGGFPPAHAHDQAHLKAIVARAG